MPNAKNRTCANCPKKIDSDNITGLCLTCLNKKRAQNAVVPPNTTPEERVSIDRDKQRAQLELAEVKAKYTAALKTIEQHEAALGWVEELRAGVSRDYVITPREGSGTSEATPIILASDWHSEEIVKPSQVNGLNEFNPDIFEQRATKFWQSSLRLIQLLNQDVKINTVVLALLGDFITGQIHEAENAENNALLPIDAIIKVQNNIIGGIEFLMDHSPYDLVIPCKVGNHSRTTKKVRVASETGHSLESLMYVHLAAYAQLKWGSRVRFILEDGYHTYLNVYGLKVRFHHGHAIQYQGGVGGLFIPAFKAVGQWNKAQWADLDCFGHFHQDKDGGSFVCNGSLIGYNAYAQRIKADFEQPKQTLLLIDKKRGRTCKWPIYVK